MGVPAFYRWLREKYGKCIKNVIEEDPSIVNGMKVPLDLTQPNPNDIEFDNLYLDMNGIIHPCVHPEDAPAPETEEDMFRAIFLYIDRLFAAIRPRKILFMAIDGVAPRAKMNQQRSRRFKAALEINEREEVEEEIRNKMSSRGMKPPPRAKATFDHNVITPGTRFMDRLALFLRYYVTLRISNEAAWRNVRVIISDASVPGEGEHKIMEFVRQQRAQPGYNPNTRHILHGLDADLIMLGLATHETHFTILREELLPPKHQGGSSTACHTCGQEGHKAAFCTGKAKEKRGKHGEHDGDLIAVTRKPLQFLHLSILREYLDMEFSQLTPLLPFPYELERVIDDFVFMCFFVGNDFLPHLPSMDIREGAIDLLLALYKQLLPALGGFMTHNGNVHLGRVDILLSRAGAVEDEIFRRRRRKEARDSMNEAQRKAETARHKQQQLQQSAGGALIGAGGGGGGGAIMPGFGNTNHSNGYHGNFVPRPLTERQLAVERLLQSDEELARYGGGSGGGTSGLTTPTSLSSSVTSPRPVIVSAATATAAHAAAMSGLGSLGSGSMFGGGSGNSSSSSNGADVGIPGLGSSNGSGGGIPGLGGDHHHGTTSSVLTSEGGNKNAAASLRASLLAGGAAPALSTTDSTVHLPATAAGESETTTTTGLKRPRDHDIDEEEKTDVKDNSNTTTSSSSGVIITDALDTFSKSVTTTSHVIIAPPTSEQGGVETPVGDEDDEFDDDDDDDDDNAGDEIVHEVKKKAKRRTGVLNPNEILADVLPSLSSTRAISTTTAAAATAASSSSSSAISLVDESVIEAGAVVDEDLAEAVKSMLKEAVTATLLTRHTHEDVEDKVRFGEQGWKDRYYTGKFGAAEASSESFRTAICKAYTEGLVWVFRYYYQGVASWKWFYPYHYAPFASDLRNLDTFDIKFELGKPFRPLDQLMAVLPALSSHALPPAAAKLMDDPASPILDFYPSKFNQDPNGKKFSWQWVVLLPFIDEQRLVNAIDSVAHTFSADEARRNQLGNETLILHESTSLGKVLFPLAPSQEDVFALANAKGGFVEELEEAARGDTSSSTTTTTATTTSTLAAEATNSGSNAVGAGESASSSTTTTPTSSSSSSSSTAARTGHAVNEFAVVVNVSDPSGSGDATRVLTPAISPAVTEAFAAATADGRMIVLRPDMGDPQSKGFSAHAVPVARANKHGYVTVIGGHYKSPWSPVLPDIPNNRVMQIGFLPPTRRAHLCNLLIGAERDAQELAPEDDASAVVPRLTRGMNIADLANAMNGMLRQQTNQYAMVGGSSGGGGGEGGYNNGYQRGNGVSGTAGYATYGLATVQHHHGGGGGGGGGGGAYNQQQQQQHLTPAQRMMMMGTMGVRPSVPVVNVTNGAAGGGGGAGFSHHYPGANAYAGQQLHQQYPVAASSQVPFQQQQPVGFRHGGYQPPQQQQQQQQYQYYPPAAHLPHQAPPQQPFAYYPPAPRGVPVYGIPPQLAAPSNQQYPPPSAHPLHYTGAGFPVPPTGVYPGPPPPHQMQQQQQHSQYPQYAFPPRPYPGSGGGAPGGPYQPPSSSYYPGRR